MRRGRAAAAAWACAALLAVALPWPSRADTQRPGTWAAYDRKARATEPWYGLDLARNAPMRVRVGPSPARLGQAIERVLIARLIAHYMDRIVAPFLGIGRRRVLLGDNTKRIIFIQKQISELSLANTGRIFQHRLED